MRQSGKVACPGCHGKGFVRTHFGGEAEDCPVCHGKRTVEGQDTVAALFVDPRGVYSNLPGVDAIRGARQRPLGDAWAWSRKNSSVDISPLVCTTLGLYGYLTAEAQMEPMVAYG